MLLKDRPKRGNVAQKGRITKMHEETFRSDKYIQYLVCVGIASQLYTIHTSKLILSTLYFTTCQLFLNKSIFKSSIKTKQANQKMGRRFEATNLLVKSFIKDIRMLSI